MAFARGTTPTLTFEIESEDLDLTNAEHIYVTIKYGNRLLTKADSDLIIAAKSIQLTLTQQETLAFGNTVGVQVNWTYSNGARWCTDIVEYRVEDQLLNRIVD